MRVCHLWNDVIAKFRRRDLGPKLSKLPNHIQKNFLHRIPWEYHPQTMAASSIWASLLQTKEVRSSRFSASSTNPPFNRLFQGYRCTMKYTVNFEECGENGENLNISAASIKDGMFFVANPQFRPPEMAALMALNLADNPILDDYLLDWDAFKTDETHFGDDWVPQGLSLTILDPNQPSQSDIDSWAYPADNPDSWTHPTEKWEYETCPELKKLTLRGLCGHLVKILKAQGDRFKGHEKLIIEAALETPLKFVYFEVAVTDIHGRRL
ncbi:hypothetical protein AA313_de0208450 [Arthrobotrys entomopaga]|nr:hypothetical protein AA313_de0208450 [Arthrobotrys entomopaga]